jgi:hypothetical protein
LLPIAADLNPQNLSNNSAVIIPDPIEDLIGNSWNQSDSYCAINLTATVKSKRDSLIFHHPLQVEKNCA